MNLKNISTMALTIALFASCGRKSDSDESGKKQETTNGQDAAQESAKKKETPGEATTGFKIVDKAQSIYMRSINGRVVESYAFFLIKTEQKDLALMNVTIDGSPAKSLPGFENAKFKQGKLDDAATKDMFGDQMTAESKKLFTNQYRDGHYFYVEDHTFRFTEEGATHRVKLEVGRNGTKVGEYEFVLKRD